MDNVCNRCLFSIPSKLEMAEEQEYQQKLVQKAETKNSKIEDFPPGNVGEYDPSFNLFL